MQENVREELAPCVVPRPDHTAHLLSLASLCSAALGRVNEGGEAAVEEFPDQFLSDCAHMGQY